jgi:hypothetical protein
MQGMLPLRNQENINQREKDNFQLAEKHFFPSAALHVIPSLFFTYFEGKCQQIIKGSVPRWPKNVQVVKSTYESLAFLNSSRLRS